MLPLECIRASEQASLRVDGALSELELASLNAHLADCPVCAAFAASVEGITGVLRETPLERPGRQFKVPAYTFSRPRALRAASAATAAIAAAAAMTLSFALRRAESLPTQVRVPAANMSSADLTQLRVLRRAQLRMPAAALNAVPVRSVVT